MTGFGKHLKENTCRGNGMCKDLEGEQNIRNLVFMLHSICLSFLAWCACLIFELLKVRV